jgi:pyruvate/2-oxoacid:ferredoxin oxidoreductase beta subunit
MLDGNSMETGTKHVSQSISQENRITILLFENLSFTKRRYELVIGLIHSVE